MYASRKKSLAAAQRSAERRQREDEAQRLKTLLPTLKTLRINVAEEAGGTTTKHVKHVVVANAPALFFIPCGDPRCEDGGHDITYDVMRALHDRRTTSTGHHSCGGTTGLSPCTRAIQFEIAATYGL